jgi:hypothetical protein
MPLAVEAALDTDGQLLRRFVGYGCNALARKEMGVLPFDEMCNGVIHAAACEACEADIHTTIAVEVVETVDALFVLDVGVWRKLPHLHPLTETVAPEIVQKVSGFGISVS